MCILNLGLLFAGTEVLKSGFLFLWSIVKSCFLLSFRDVVFMLLGLGVAQIVYNVWTLPRFLGDINPAALRQQLTVPYVIIQTTLMHFAGSLFAAILYLLIRAERRSRTQSEALAREVEALATDLERMRIARNIHDSLGHTLTSAAIQLEVAQKMRSHNLDRAFQAIDKAAVLTGQCLQDVRQTVSTIRGSAMDLNVALTHLTEQLHQQGIVCDIDLQLPLMSLSISHQLYYVAKEGLINIQKHAQALHVTLRGYVLSDDIVVEICDDGQGFDRTQQHLGFGLQGISERIELLKGTVNLETQPG
ncbi:sensor histidine kinase [Phormidesmis sp. 146-12]